MLVPRIRKWLRRVSQTGALGKELMLLANKSPLAHMARYMVDLSRHGVRKERMLARPVVESLQEQAILRDLNQHGWAAVPDSIGLNWRQRIADECMTLQQEYQEANRREQTRHKTIWNYLSDIRYAGKKPDETDPLVQYALSPPILNVATSYLGEIPWLRYVILTESIYQPGEATYSQKWHLDFDDARMLKLFVYLSDVRSPEDGPFRLINRDASAHVRNSFFRRHLSDEEVFSDVSHKDVVDMFGQRLSSFIVDTSRVYHCGSRMMQGHSRLLYTALYTGFPSIYPHAADAFSVTPAAAKLMRQILTPLSCRQKQ